MPSPGAVRTYKELGATEKDGLYVYNGCLMSSVGWKLSEKSLADGMSRAESQAGGTDLRIHFARKRLTLLRGLEATYRPLLFSAQFIRDVTEVLGGLALQLYLRVSADNSQ